MTWYIISIKGVQAGCHYPKLCNCGCLFMIFFCRAIAEAVKKHPPRVPPSELYEDYMRLSGL